MYQVSNYNTKVGSSTVVKVGETKYKSNVLRMMHSGLDDKTLVLCRLTAVANKGSRDRRNRGKEYIEV